MKDTKESHILEFEVSKNQIPSWMSYGKGHANLRVQGHKQAGWLSIVINEHGEKSSKQTMITLDVEDAMKLRLFLNDVLSVGA